ncbi:MAG TPA: hypothetical protein VM096_19505 [Vicinamibacterales bacterium]|nr:hypothetical protein [Vicinamibacterales bacterium]
MDLRSRFTTVVLAILGLVSCSHGVVRELPAAPSTPQVAIVRLTITPVGGARMLEGQTATITSSGPLPEAGQPLGAFAQYSDGSGKFVGARWTSSDATVIAVNDTTFTAMARGTVTITAAAEGKTASESFIVEPGIAGTWSGQFVVDQCAAGSGSMNELICFAPNQGRPPGALAVGTAAPIALVISKANGNDLTAAAQLGDLRGVLTGTDRGSNALTLKGNLTLNGTTLTLVHWDARVVTDSMEGFIGFELRIPGVPSFAQVTAHLDNVTRR